MYNISIFKEKRQCCVFADGIPGCACLNSKFNYIRIYIYIMILELGEKKNQKIK